jgi:hypothetical protein
MARERVGSLVHRSLARARVDERGSKPPARSAIAVAWVIQLARMTRWNAVTRKSF